MGPTYAWRSPRIGGTDSWITHLVRKFAEGCDSSADLKKNKLKIVTFNYDQIVEYAFLHVLRGAGRYSSADSSFCPKTYHVYGKFPELKSHLSPSDILEASKSIRYMFEVTDPTEDDESRAHLYSIRETIKNASYVYIVGFDVDPKNAALIGLDKCSARIFALNYDGNPKLQSRLIAIGAEADHIYKGETTTACENGFFDLMDLYPNPKYQIKMI